MATFSFEPSRFPKRKMSGLIDKRKRSREDDFCCESTPLSKRINNLHLTNNLEEAAAHTTKHYQQQQHQDHQEHNNSIIENNGFMAPKMIVHKNEQQSLVDLTMLQEQHEQQQQQYNPDLDEVDNPYYYMKNKLLHELHLERLKRCID